MRLCNHQNLIDFNFHVVSQAAGAFMAYVASYLIKTYHSFDSFIQDRYTLIPAVIIIGISLFMFLFGLVGCCSTLKESKVGLSFVSVTKASQIVVWVPLVAASGRAQGQKSFK